MTYKSMTIPDGVPVPGPGVYSLSMEHYHSQACCPGPSVSSSGLRKIYLESPADFWAFSDLNDHRFDQEPNDAFTFGRAAHALILGDEDFNAKFAVVPSNAPPTPLESQWEMLAQGRKLTASAEERLSFWEPFLRETEGKELLSESDLTHIRYIAEAMERHEIVPILMQGQAEQSLIWQDDTGIWLKSRLDMLSATGDLADLKSTSSKSLRDVNRDVFKYGLDMQLGLATMAMEKVLGVPFDPAVYEGRAAILLFVYKKPPYHVMPVELSFTALHYGRLKCRQAINRMAKCMREDYWPGPFEGIAPIETPAWEVEKITEMQQSRLFPVTSDDIGDFGDME